MHVIIRDDDTSFFTTPELLERAYARLWEKHIPVSLAVIPAQRSDVRVDHRPGKPYDPSIPPVYRGQSKEHPVVENRELCAFLNTKARDGLVEICLHGCSHSYMEFATQDVSLIRRKLSEGKRILQEAMPDAPIRTFIAPYDKISKPALELVYQSGLNLCTHSENLASIPSLRHVGSHQGHRLENGLKLFTCNEYLFTHRDDPDYSLTTATQRLQAGSMVIVGNHYWTFSYDWDGPNQPLLAAWHRFVDQLLSNTRYHLTTFSACDVAPLETTP